MAELQPGGVMAGFEPQERLETARGLPRLVRLFVRCGGVAQEPARLEVTGGGLRFTPHEQEPGGGCRATELPQRIGHIQGPGASR